jgi:hypothetical protein
MLSGRITQFGGSAEPPGSLGEIARSANAFVIGMAKVQLSSAIPLLGSSEEQAERPCSIFVNAKTTNVKAAKVVLSHGVSLESGLFITFRSSSVIVRDTMTVLVEVTEKKLRAWIILRSGGAEPLQSDIVACGIGIGLQKEMD